MSLRALSALAALAQASAACALPCGWPPEAPSATCSEVVEGEIALTDSPFCEFFVVRTDRGFSLLQWRAGMLVFAEGDRVRGPLHTRGDHIVELVGHATLTARVEEVGVGLRRAQGSYYRRCKIESSPEAGNAPAIATR